MYDLIQALGGRGHKPFHHTSVAETVVAVSPKTANLINIIVENPDTVTRWLQLFDEPMINLAGETEDAIGGDPLYQWNASGTANEYYLSKYGGGDPGLSEPTIVLEPDADEPGLITLAAGTAGSLTAGQWDWGDNDTLGYNTIYVRLTGDTDPRTLDKGQLAASDVTVGTTIPVMTIPVPEGGTNINGIFHEHINVRFQHSLSFAFTDAEHGSGAPSNPGTVNCTWEPLAH